MRATTPPAKCANSEPSLREDSLFKTMLGRKSSREVKVSAAFRACFTQSEAFRVAVLSVLQRTCGCRIRRASDWACDSEVIQPDRGRIDLQISSRTAGLVFQLENKVEAPLTEPQMNRYRVFAAGKLLIAITKYPPTVGTAWLRARGCYSLRWQDMHRALLQVEGAKGVNRFLCESFAGYLEELGMAHREDVRVADVAEVHRLLRCVASDRKWSSASGAAFETANDCMGIINDVVTHALNAEPRLARWTRSGPAYTKWTEPNGTWHLFGFRFLIKSWTRWIGAALIFPDWADEKPYWETHGRLDKYFDTHHSLRSVASNGVLDSSKMAKAFLKDRHLVKVLR